MSLKRQLTWQARLGSTRVREGSKKAAVTCWEDFTTGRLVPFKLTFFFMIGATHLMSPFATLFARSLGLSIKETAIVFAVSPLIPLLAPILAGIIADKIGNFKMFLIVSVAISGVVPLFSMTIPQARIISNSISDNVTFHLVCSTKGPLDDTFVLKLNDKGDDCNFLNHSVTVESIRAQECGYECKEPVVKYPKNRHKNLKGMTVKADHIDNGNEYDCKIDDYYFNAPQKCFPRTYNESLVNADNQKSFTLNKVLLELHNRAPYQTLNLHGKYLMNPSDQRAYECGHGHMSSDVNLTTTEIGKTTTTADYYDETVETREKRGIKPHSVCKLHCEVSLLHDTVCEMKDVNEEQKVSLTIWLYISVNVCMSFGTGLTYTLFEIATIAVLRQHGNKYGLQRLYGSIGGMLFAPLAGLVIDSVGEGGGYQDYYITFVMFLVVKLICCGVLTAVDLRFKTPTKNLLQNMCKLMMTAEVFLLLLVVMMSGICYGFIEHFQPWLLQEIGAEHWLIGLTTTIASVAALPFLAISDSVCAKFGHVQTISFGLVCYAIRCIGYSLLTNPFWCIPLEIIEGATTGLLITATILYAAKLSPRTSQYTQGTLQGVVATVHYGIGKSLGCFAGGFLISALGFPAAFQIFSGIAFGVAFCYYLIFKLYLLPQHQQLEVLRREVCNMPIKTVSMKQHRRLSMRYDKNVIIPLHDDPNENGEMAVRESTFKNDDDVPAYRYQHQNYDDYNDAANIYPDVPDQDSCYPSWSDEDDTLPVPPYPPHPNTYQTLGGTPNSSTPFKYTSPLPQCDVSNVPGVKFGTADETTEASTFLDKTNDQ